MEKFNVIQEALTDYSCPILVFGDIEQLLVGRTPAVVSITGPSNDFCIFGGRLPEWVSSVLSKAKAKTNLLVIKDMDKVDFEKQGLLFEILKNNQISSSPLPSNLKIILVADKVCKINPKILMYVECHEVKS